MPVAASHPLSTLRSLPPGFQDLLDRADVRLDGSRPWDVEVRDSRLFARVVARGTLGFGEAYMDGWWESGQIDELVFRLVKAGVRHWIPRTLRDFFTAAITAGWNMQSKARAGMVARRHYDLGNDFYASFLDPYLQYSCAYFRNGENLAQAQVRKMDLIRAKLQLRPETSLVDIGCGWGGLARYLAGTVGCRVTGINISAQQIAYAREACAGLPVEIQERDYRDLEGPFDAAVSVGMFEHVGSRNARTFMRAVHRSLRDGGLFLLHTIGSNVSSRRGDPWLHRYIFPNGQLPSAAQITGAAEGLFVLEDWHNFGTSYDRTLLAWHRNFEEA